MESRGTLDHVPKPKTSFLIEDILFSHRSKVPFLFKLSAKIYANVIFMPNSNHLKKFKITAERQHLVVTRHRIVRQNWTIVVTRCFYLVVEVVVCSNSKPILLVMHRIIRSFQMHWLRHFFAQRHQQVSISEVNVAVK